MLLLDQLAMVATIAAALVCGLMGGLFFAFSNFVMQALARLPPPAGIAAMQSINAVVLNRLFLTLFSGCAVLCLLLAVYALAVWERPGSGWLLLGGALYCIGTFVVTAACNVPRNRALDRVDAASPAAEPAWRDYLVDWTRWNHVRTVTALAAAAALMMAL